MENLQLTKSELEVVFTTNFKKFTKPQQAIISKFLEGHKLTIVNKHQMNGGDWMWVSPSSKYLENAGHTSKAYRGIYYSMRELTGAAQNLSAFFVV
jgi:hypothetical protein